MNVGNFREIVFFVLLLASFCNLFHVDKKETVYLFPYVNETSFPLSHFHSEFVNEELGVKQLLFLSSYTPSCVEGEGRCYFEIEGRSFRVRILGWKRISEETYHGDVVELVHDIVEAFPQALTDYDEYLGTQARIVKEVAIRWIDFRTAKYVNMQRNAVNTALQLLPYHENILFTYLHLPLFRDPHDKSYRVEASLQVFEYYFHDLDRFLINTLHSNYFENLIWKSGISIFSDPESVRYLAKKMAKDILSALAHFHENGWIHNDVRTGNILLVRKSTEVDFEEKDLSIFDKIGGVEFDFKLSGMIDSATNSCEKYVLGTNKTSFYLYGNSFQMSPEMVRKECYSYKHDIYALGIVLYSLMVESFYCLHHSDGKCYRHLTTEEMRNSGSGENDQIRNYRLNTLGPFPLYPQPKPPKTKEELEKSALENERRVDEFLKEIESIHNEMFEKQSGDLRVLSPSSEHLNTIEDFLGGDALDFLRMMTNRDPEKRCSARECLNHPFLMNEELEEEEEGVHVKMHFDSIFMFQEMHKKIEKDINDISRLIKKGSTPQEIKNFYNPVRMNFECESVMNVFRTFTTKEEDLLDKYQGKIKLLMDYCGLGERNFGKGESDEL